MNATAYHPLITVKISTWHIEKVDVKLQEVKYKILFYLSDHIVPPTYNQLFNLED